MAAITAERDRHLLEVSMAEALYTMLGAQKINLFQVALDKSVPRARLVAGIRGDQPIAMLDPLTDIADWPAIDDSTAMLECFDRASPVRVPCNEDSGFQHFLPVTDGNNISAIIQIERRIPLSPVHFSLIEGVLQVVRNQRALLDYSEHDTLTRLNNRKTFDDAYAQRVLGRGAEGNGRRTFELVGRRRVLRPGDCAWLAVIDIDFFKRINDRFGHVFGDEVLLMTSQLMRNSFRATDAMFRFGGEEFVVLIAPTNEAGAAAAVDRFRQKIESHTFPQVGNVTVSIGYSAARGTDAATAVFEHADAALYYAKQHGRNQSRCYEVLIQSGELKDKDASGEIELF